MADSDSEAFESADEDVEEKKENKGKARKKIFVQYVHFLQNFLRTQKN